MFEIVSLVKSVELNINFLTNIKSAFVWLADLTRILLPMFNELRLTGSLWHASTSVLDVIVTVNLDDRLSRLSIVKTVLDFLVSMDKIGDILSMDTRKSNTVLTIVLRWFFDNWVYRLVA